MSEYVTFWPAIVLFGEHWCYYRVAVKATGTILIYLTNFNLTAMEVHNIMNDLVLFIYFDFTF